MIYAMLLNTKDNRYHPILFRLAPMPGNADANALAQRYKSKGHHTEGFATFDEAVAHIDEKRKEHGYQVAPLIMEWDGEGVPMMVQWFALPVPTEDAHAI
jgi:hypothetical protein